MLRRDRWVIWAIVLLAAIGITPAATRTELIASATQTASGNSGAFSLATARDIMVGVDFTTGSSVTDLDLWLQASDDGGTTWYDYPADIVLTSANTAATGTIVSVASRDIVDSYSSTTAAQFVGIYKSIASDKIRLKWIFTGTSFTLSASMVAK